MTKIHRPARLATRAASFRYGGRHHSGIPGGIIPLYPGDFVGIRSLAIGVDVGSESYADKIVTRCRDKGLLIGSEGEALTLFPPLVVDDDIANEAINLLQACL